MTTEQEISFVNRMRDVSTTVITRWWLLLLCIVITMSSAYVYLRQQTPIYRASAKVVVSQRPPRVMVGIQEVAEVADGTTRRYREYITTQLDVIRSHDIAQEVLDRLDLWENPNLFEADNPDDDALTADELRTKRAATLANNIGAQDIPDSMVVEIAFENADPELAAAIATTTAEVFRDHNLTLKKQIAEDAGTDLKEVVETRLKKKQDIESTLEAFENNQNIGAIESRRTDVLDALALFNRKLREATANRIGLGAELEQVKKLTKKGARRSSAPQVLNNTVVTELKLHYIRKQAEVAGLRETYGPKHPKLAAAQRQLSKLSGALKKEVRAILKSVQIRYDSAVAEEMGLAKEAKEAELKADRIAMIVNQAKKLQKKLKDADGLYEQVAKRHKETQLTAGLAKNNIRVLNPALVPKKPIRPRRTLVLTLAGFLGFMVGVALSLLLETVDTTIRSKSHAEKVAGVPCLGLVPNIVVPNTPDEQGESKRHRDLFVYYNSSSAPAEMGRTLRTNLLFLSAERKLKTLLVTSPLPQEGKTTVAVQTSIALAMAGGRTLLVEADLRRPRLAETFGVDVDMGLSLFLADPNKELKDVVATTEVDNLDVVVCGRIPPNPAELLNGSRIDDFIKKASKEYDRVLFDSPPVNAVADAMILTNRVDGVLLVLKSGRTTTEALRHATNTLQSVAAPLVGVILNDLRETHMGYYRHSYYRKGYYSLSDEERQRRGEKPPLEVVKS